MQRYFTSDLHLLHEKAWNLRGLSAAEGVEEVLLEFGKLKKKSITYNLGDFALKGISQWGHIIDQFPGIQRALLGNHDAPHALFEGASSRQVEWFRHFDSVEHFTRLRLGGKYTVLLSHFPYDGEGKRDQPDRHVWARLRDEGVILLHGHTHDSDQRFSRSNKGTPMVHVGWDAWRRPVSEVDIVRLLDENLAAEG